MVDLKQQNGATGTGTVSWETVTRLMRERGYPDEEIADLVTAADNDKIHPFRADELAELLGLPIDCGRQPITLKDAVVKYAKPRQTLHTWLRSSHLQALGRIKGPGPGGLVVIDENELLSLLADPPKTGVNRTKYEELAPGALAELLGLPADCGVQPITLKDAAAKYHKSPHTLHTWLRSSHLQVLGRIKGPGPGGLVVIDENELLSLLADPPKTGVNRTKRVQTTS